MKQQEQEWHAHQGQPTQHRGSVYSAPQPQGDKGERIHHYDDENVWTIETYNSRLATHLAENGAQEKPCLHDGRLFVVDARQLIEYIAQASGVVVDFPKRRKRQYSEETLTRLRERGRALQMTRKKCRLA